MQQCNLRKPLLILHSERGESLVMVLIAVGISAFLAVSNIYLFHHMTKSNQTSQFQMEVSGAQREILEYLDSSTSCLATMQGISVATFPFTFGAVKVQMSGAAAPEEKFIADNDTRYGNRTFVLRSLSVGNPGDALGPNLINKPLDLVAGFVAAQEVYGSGNMTRKLGVIYFTTNAVGTVTRCGSSPSFNSSFIASQNFTLIANRNDGSPGPAGLCASNGSVLGENCVHNPGAVWVKTMAIPGNWSICFLSGQQTTADDANVYDACYIDQLTASTWQIRSFHHREDALLCRATCLR